MGSYCQKIGLTKGPNSLLIANLIFSGSAGRTKKELKIASTIYTFCFRPRICPIFWATLLPKIYASKVAVMCSHCSVTWNNPSVYNIVKQLNSQTQEYTQQSTHAQELRIADDVMLTWSSWPWYSVKNKGFTICYIRVYRSVVCSEYN